MNIGSCILICDLDTEFFDKKSNAPGLKIKKAKYSFDKKTNASLSVQGSFKLFQIQTIFFHCFTLSIKS